MRFKQAMCTCALIAASTAVSAQSGWAPNASSTSAAERIRVGRLALARHTGSDDWYPAMVLELKGNLATVQYSGGSTESLPMNLIRPMVWQRGSKIHCKLDGGDYVAVTIVEMSDDYSVDLVDSGGRTHHSSLRFCRAQPARNNWAN